MRFDDKKTVPPTVAKGRFADEIVKTRLIRKGFGVEKITGPKTFDFKVTDKDGLIYLTEVKYSKSWEFLNSFKVFSIRMEEMDRMQDYAIARNAKSAVLYFVDPVSKAIYYNSFRKLLEEEITVKSVNGEDEARFPKTSSTRKYLFAVAQFKEMDKLTEAEIKKFYEIDNPPQSPSRDEEFEDDIVPF